MWSDDYLDEGVRAFSEQLELASGDADVGLTREAAEGFVNAVLAAVLPLHRRDVGEGIAGLLQEHLSWDGEDEQIQVTQQVVAQAVHIARVVGGSIIDTVYVGPNAAVAYGPPPRPKPPEEEREDWERRRGEPKWA